MKPGLGSLTLLYSGVVAFVAGTAMVFAPQYWAALPDGYWNTLVWGGGTLMSAGLALLVVAIL